MTEQTTVQNFVQVISVYHHFSTLKQPTNYELHTYFEAKKAEDQNLVPKETSKEHRKLKFQPIGEMITDAIKTFSRWFGYVPPSKNNPPIADSFQRMQPIKPLLHASTNREFFGSQKQFYPNK